MDTESPKIITIKRYSNRKLYDTSQSRYITLAELGELIRRGENIEVIDNDTKADLTEMTLAQVLIAQKKQKHNGLRSLVQSQAEILIQRLSVPVQQIRDEAIRQVEKKVESLRRITKKSDNTPPPADVSSKQPVSKPQEAETKEEPDKPTPSILTKLESLKESSDEKLLSLLLVQRIEQLEDEVEKLKQRLSVLENNANKDKR
ncbi:MAG: polyhydroxyalkanoate synthesis regulator DNA-binding domain-containing protein [Proteobacteria bacterium]|nr:polyhydroxyalkanoate synthesis regulator DNA-binding domain-containing protein [Pseudomonadota bacterium]